MMKNRINRKQSDAAKLRRWCERYGAWKQLD
jgi:hypothetical protein